MLVVGLGIKGLEWPQSIFIRMASDTEVLGSGFAGRRYSWAMSRHFNPSLTGSSVVGQTQPGYLEKRGFWVFYWAKPSLINQKTCFFFAQFRPDFTVAGDTPFYKDFLVIFNPQFFSRNGKPLNLCELECEALHITVFTQT